jgi:hypothetical protein
MKKIVIALLFSVVHCLTTVAQIGTWKNYLAYHDVQQIQAAGNDQLFVLASNSLYQYNKNDQSIVTYDKVNGLSDTYITHIRWCPQAKRLIAVYGNTNIDLIDTNGNVINISDIYTKVITGEKSINSIHISGQYAYLACGFGIVKLNVQRAEISESYMLGFPVTAVTTDNSFIYAQTASDVWKAPLSSNLIDKSNWIEATTAPSFTQDTKDYDENIDVVRTLQPGGPKHNMFGYMKYVHNKLYTCNGDYNSAEPIQVLNNNEWTIYQHEGIADVTGVAFTGSFCFDVDPADENHVFAGARNGLYEYQNGQFLKFYNSDNSPIESFNKKDKEYEIISGVKFDLQGNNLYLLNTSAPTTAMIRYSNGSFSKLDHTELMKLNTRKEFPNCSNAELSKMIIDSQGIMWFVNNNWVLPAFYQYNMESDAIRAYESFTNEDGTKIDVMEGVRCIVEDRNNDLWLGSSVGPFVLKRSDIYQDSPTYVQVKVPRNDGTNYADYLLAGIDIMSMAIDSGGRKWFGTNGNGVYLISADNMSQIQHFTTDNSALLSNVVKSIAINPTTGEVFFGTENGLCSYMSDATQTNEEMTSDNVWAYPNPVNPGYTGPITITGLSYDADVKILSANGALVHEGRSNGGTYIWYGNDQKGRRVASGVYMVVTATRTGEKGTVCKIAVIN